MTVRFEVAFISAYAVVLLAVAWGLWRLGRVNNDPWKGRLLAGHRRGMPDAPHAAGAHDWPHSEAPRLYTGVALVAATAATLLCVAEAFRHHAAAELGSLASVGALGLASVRQLARSLGGPRVRRGWIGRRSPTSSPSS
jgi:hypothetical protein